MQTPVFICREDKEHLKKVLAVRRSMCVGESFVVANAACGVTALSSASRIEPRAASRPNGFNRLSRVAS